MWNFFIQNSRFTFLLIVVLIGFGLLSVFSIPKESAPEVQVPVGVVTTILSGAPAVDIENLITNEIERGLSGSLENVKKITSTSKESVSTVVVEFSAEADIDKSIDQLKDKVDTLITKLPNNAERPLVSEVNFVDQPIFTLAVSGDLSDQELSLVAEDLVDEFESINGVSRVEKSGVREQEVSVVVDQLSLLKFDLTISEVINAIRQAGEVFPVGQIVTDGVYYNIVLDSGVETVDMVEKIPVTTRGGQPVLVKDVAKVVVGLAPSNTFTRLSTDNEPSNPALTLNVYKNRGGDITIISDDIVKKISELENTLLKDLSTYIVFDAGFDIKRDLSNLTKSGMQTVILVIAILMVAIGWREGLIAGLAIPLSFTIGFIGLYLSDNTLNFISLFALILGIGVLVDSGIVIVEGINKRLKDSPNLNKIEAGILTVKEFKAPLTSGTLTTVSMFMGLFIVSGVTGQFIAGIPFTLIFILLASLIVALGFLPLITSNLISEKKVKDSDRWQNATTKQIETKYRKILTYFLESKKAKTNFLIAIFIGLISAVALIPFGLVKVVFFEQSNVDDVFVEIEMPESTIKETTDLTVRKMEEMLFKHEKDIEAYLVTVGAGSVFSTGGQNSKLANFHIALNPEREITSLNFVEALRKDFSEINEAKVTVNLPNNGPPVGSPIGIKLFGEDLTILNNTATEISQILSTIEGTTNIKTGTESNIAEIVFTVDQEKASVFGFNPQIISQTLRSTVYGSEATSISTLKNDIPVMVRLNLTSDQNIDPEFSNWTTVDTLQNIELSTQNSDRIPLSAFVDISLREASSVINHENQARVVTAGADITATGNVIEINKKLREEIEKNNIIPEGVTYSLGGEAEESNQAFMELFLALVVGIVLMIGILVLQFDSYRHTFYVLSILPFSLIGILYGLAFTGSALSFPSIMGFIALSGIIVNNSILLIDMMNKMRKNEPQKTINEIVIESSVNRLRPILLTSASTIIGMLPLLYSDEIWIPLATAVIFGLAFSVVITLIMVPIIYSKWPGKVRAKF